jgi:hypothetical protein
MKHQTLIEILNDKQCHYIAVLETWRLQHENNAALVFVVVLHLYSIVTLSHRSC